MIDVLAVIDTPHWAFARRVESIRRHAPADFRFNVACYTNVSLRTLPYGRYDLVWCLVPSKLAEIREAMRLQRTDRPLVGAHNSGIGRSGYHLTDVTAIADWTIVNNHAAWASGLGARDYRACCISNGVDLDVYQAVAPVVDRTPLVLWTASDSKAGDASDIKGFRGILKPLSRILAGNNVETDFRIVSDSPFSEQEMVQWYNRGSTVVCASSSEGTPNFILEGAACGCAVVSSHVGNIPELVTHEQNGVIVYERHTGAFWDAVQYAEQHRERLTAAMSQTLADWHWAKRSRWYYAVFRRLLKGGVIDPFSWIDTPAEEVWAETAALPERNGRLVHQ